MWFQERKFLVLVENSSSLCAQNLEAFSTGTPISRSVVIFFQMTTELPLEKYPVGIFPEEALSF